MSSFADALNQGQRAAVEHGDGPLLVIAGAGSGKTMTLAHRVAQLILRGADPRRMLLLTFTRRAAVEMTRRAERIIGQAAASGGGRGTADRMVWSGTFHSVANRLLRVHARDLGLDPAFTILDREDAADLMDLLRHERGLSHTKSRFPQKGTCLAIYSHVVNAERSLGECLRSNFPWCVDWEAELKGLFGAYVETKQQRQTLDYDDLLLWWAHLMTEPSLAARIGDRFDHVLVDEYQDTNALQARILLALKPNGRGLTVVGDDAQAIYSFRAATVRNILDFPGHFQPPATVVTLEENYRSSEEILHAANAVIALAPERYQKELRSTRGLGEKPRLVTVEDEAAQAEHVAGAVLARREAGMALRQQAVLFRAAHHSAALEIELGRRGIPFVKFGGLRFLEAAHVKDVVCTLRLAENPRDGVAAFRVLQLLPGMGPALAKRAWGNVEAASGDLSALSGFRAPDAAREDWPALCSLLTTLAAPGAAWPAQLDAVRRWYDPHLARLYDDARTRAGDLDALMAIGARSPSRERFLSDLALDPPEVSGAEAGDPTLDEDFLILSTIHSAKGQEWEAVYLLNAVDGCIPSDLATGELAQIEEERRLLYVAMTRAKTSLELLHPYRFFVRSQHRFGDRAVIAPRTRFIPDAILDRFTRVGVARSGANDVASVPSGTGRRVDVGAKIREMWR